ncbi:MAG: leucyl aminopeptidase [Thermodesulfobacteriota bacterium]
MNFTLKTGNYLNNDSDLLIFTKFSDQPFSSELKKIDKKINKGLSRKSKDADFKGEKGSVLTLDTIGSLKSKSIFVIGLGSKKEFSTSSCYRSFASAGRKLSAKDKEIRIFYELPNKKNIMSSALEGLIQGSYVFNKYKTDNNKPHIKNVELYSKSLNVQTFKRENNFAVEMSDAVKLARDVVNEPPLFLTPTKLADISATVAKEGNIEIKVFDKEEIIKMNMGALYAVSRGSTQPPKFIHFTYTPRSKYTNTIAVVGKGITFDSGGLCLKPADSMLTMKMDMSGAATVLGVMKAVSKLKPKIKVHGIIPATENMTGGDAYKPDDVIYAMNGKSIEVINTDAEGRLALSDALSYTVKNLKVNEIIDLATLTGACIVGLGSYTAGVMGNNEKLVKNILGASENVGEKMWQLPLDDELRKEIKSKIADIKNVGSRWGGAITAGLFLENFVSEKPWAHIDIAGPAYLNNGNDVYPAGGTGFGVRTIINYILEKN